MLFKVSSPATKVSPVVGSRSSPPMSPGSFSRHSAVVAAQAIESSRRQEQSRNRVGQVSELCSDFKFLHSVKLFQSDLYIFIGQMTEI